MLQLIRSSACLLAQQLFPRAHVQLRESFTCQIRVVLVELRVILAVAQEANGSVPYDQLLAAHPHVHDIMYTVRIRCVDGCIAKCVQSSKINPSQQNHCTSATTSSCICLQNWAHTHQMVNGVVMLNRRWQHVCRSKFVHTCKNDHFWSRTTDS